MNIFLAMSDLSPQFAFFSNCFTMRAPHAHTFTYTVCRIYYPKQRLTVGIWHDIHTIRPNTNENRNLEIIKINHQKIVNKILNWRMCNVDGYSLFVGLCAIDCLRVIAFGERRRRKWIIEKWSLERYTETVCFFLNLDTFVSASATQWPFSRMNENTRKKKWVKGHISWLLALSEPWLTNEIEITLDGIIVIKVCYYSHYWDRRRARVRHH